VINDAALAYMEERNLPQIVIGKCPTLSHPKSRFERTDDFAAIRQLDRVYGSDKVQFGTPQAVTCRNSLDFGAVPSIAWCRPQRR